MLRVHDNTKEDVEEVIDVLRVSQVILNLIDEVVSVTDVLFIWMSSDKLCDWSQYETWPWLTWLHLTDADMIE